MGSKLYFIDFGTYVLVFTSYLGDFEVAYCRADGRISFKEADVGYWSPTSSTAGDVSVRYSIC